MPFKNSPVAHEILYGPTKTALIGEAGGSIVYNRALIDFARHNWTPAQDLPPSPAQNQGKVERPYRILGIVLKWGSGLFLPSGITNGEPVQTSRMTQRCSEP